VSLREYFGLSLGLSGRWSLFITGCVVSLQFLARRERESTGTTSNFTVSSNNDGGGGCGVSWELPISIFCRLVRTRRLLEQNKLKLSSSCTTLNMIFSVMWVFNVTMATHRMTLFMNKWTNVVMKDGWDHSLPKTLPSFVINLWWNVVMGNWNLDGKSLGKW
jgi:hypothetical protein